jgi:hypothetical protein
MLIFLDIDGVMLPCKSWVNPQNLSDGFPAFSNRAVFVLQKIIAPDTTIIITSSHKSRFNPQEWKNIFKRRGINIDHLITLAPASFGMSRKDEILNWFKFNPSNLDFIIIDDDKSLNDLPPSIKVSLIQTSATIGLTEEHFEEILSKRKLPTTITP